MLYHLIKYQSNVIHCSHNVITHQEWSISGVIQNRNPSINGKSVGCIADYYRNMHSVCFDVNYIADTEINDPPHASETAMKPEGLYHKNRLDT